MLTITFLSLMVAYVVADVAGAFDEVEDDADGDDVSVSNVSPDGADIIIGTDMMDVVRAGDGDDQVSGEGGNDELFGDEGNDNVFGGAGDDRIFLGDGNDVSAGQSAGDDFLRGGSGDDVIIDDQGSNTIFGDLGSDVLNAIDLDSAAGSDTIFGGFGADELFGDDGDTLTGGAGQDMFIVDEQDVSDAPVRISDAEDGETICLVVPQANQSDSIVTRLAGNGTDLEVLFRDEVLAVLEGRTNADGLSLQLAPNIFAG